VFGVIVAVGAFVFLGRLNSAIPINEDGVRDQLFARDCAEFRRCHLTGPPSSFAEFYQGTVWVDLLAAIRMLGGDVSTDRRVVLALLALSVATVFVVVWRWIRPSLALPAAVFMIAGLSLDRYPSLLTNPCTSAFVDVLAATGLLCYGLSAKLRFLFLAAFAWAVAINVHLASVTLLPALIVVPLLVEERSLLALLAVASVAFAVCVATSPATFAANVSALSHWGAVVPGLVGGSILILMSSAMGARFRRLGWYARAWVIGFVLVAPFGLAASWLVHVEGHQFGLMYLHPIFGPGAALLAATVCVPFELAARWRRGIRWVPTLAAVVLASSYGSSVPRDSAAELWTLEDAQKLVTYAEGQGYTFEELMLHLQGPSCWELLVGMSTNAAPPKGAPPREHDRRQLQVIPAAADARARVASASLVPLSNGTSAALRTIESWLDPDRLIACRIPTDGSGELCWGTSEPNAEEMAADRFFASLYSDFGLHPMQVSPPYIARYAIPLVPSAGERRELHLQRGETFHDGDMPDCNWQITRVEGVEVGGQLPARHVRLHSQAGARGMLVIEKPFGTPLCQGNGDMDRGYPPCVLEFPDDLSTEAAESSSPS
jgi:hypothetical protein